MLARTVRCPDEGRRAISPQNCATEALVQPLQSRPAQMRKLVLICVVAWLVGCGSSEKPQGDLAASSHQALATDACGSHSLQVTDLHADFREIWKGLEDPTSGKQASPYASVTLDLSAPVQSAALSGSFEPVITDGSCGSSVPTTLAGSVIAPSIWGNATTNASRKPQPEAFNLLALETISGVTSSAGAMAAGGDITLPASMSVNYPALQPFGVVAGGKLTLSSGSISGNVTYGIPSSVPQTVSVSGQKSLQRFLVGDAFQSLVEVSNLLAGSPAPGAVQLSFSTLALTGTSAGTNLFRVAAQTLQQATSIEIHVPSGAAAIVDVTGLTPQLQSKGISLQGVTPNRLLWNFSHATALSVASISVPGSILAPQARFTFTSGDINGTIVARSLTSPGSGSLRYAPLDAAAVFAPIASSSVTLMPAKPLVHDCDYRLTLPSTQPIGPGNACLGAPFSVAFHVAGDRLAAADRELTGVQRDRATGSLQRFAARAGINTPVADALARYESAIGIGHAELSSGTLRASFVNASQQFALYGQVSQGYPVLGYGYSVSSENGIFRSAFGKVAQSLPAMPAASVSEASALQAVLSALHVTKAPWLISPASYQAPHGQLVIAAARFFPAPSDFKLTWRFPLGKPTGLFAALEARVDATTGKVTSMVPGTESIVSFDPAAAIFDRVATANLEASFVGTQTLSVAAYHNKQDGSAVATFATDNVSNDGAVATALDSSDELVIDLSKLQFVTDPTPDGTWSPKTELVETRMGVVQWTLEKVTKFLPSLGLQQGDLPWSHIDGTAGKRRVLAAYFDAGSGFPTGYRETASDASLALITIRNSDTRQYFAPSVMSHEYGHALVDSLRNYSHLEQFHEPASIDEGVADLFSVTHAQADGLATPWYCIYLAKPGDLVPSVCLRNIADPRQSEKPQAAAYKDALYKDYSSTFDISCGLPENDNCGAHQNASIVSHWGYLLAAGSDPTVTSGPGAPAACGLALSAVDQDLTTALGIATNVALSATAHLSNGASFAEYRDATLTAASGLATKLNKPDLVEQVSLAWAGMGLPPDSMGSTKVAPGDDTKVSPWVEFAWPTDGLGQSATSWDFELATSAAFDAASLKYSSDSAKPITEVSQKYPEPRAFIDLALPSEPAARYYWRVRPHDTNGWQQCYPIHSFETTGMNPAVGNPKIMTEVVKPKAVPILVRPGSIKTEFDSSLLAKEYQVSVRGPDDAPCQPNNQQFAETTAGCDDCTLEQVIPSQGPPWLLPQHNYALDIRAVGPLDLQGQTALGECSSIDFDTDKMRPPSLDPDGKPDDGAIFYDGLNGAADPPQFQWQVFDGAVQSKLQFFAIDAKGVCGKTPLEQLVETPCADDCTSQASGTMLPSPPNPAGYCWDVIALSGDGLPSEASAPQRKFFYQHAAVGAISPGVQFSGALGFVVEKEPASLGKDSYGTAVTFNWSADASASAYHFRLDRWEGIRDDLATSDPSNCAIGFNPLSLGTGCDAPLEKIFDEELTATTRTFDAPTKMDDVCPSCGRYCWSIWPEFKDSKGKLLNTPLVQLDRLCYTSGPSKPVIFIDGPADLKTDTGQGDTVTQSSFTGAAITGHIHYGYVPDDALKVTPSSDDIVLGDECTTTWPASGTPTTFAPYRDVYNCDRKFTITPKPGQTYTIDTQVFSPVFTTSHDPIPPTKAFDVSLSITTPDCGGESKQCCNGACNSKTLSCQGNVCKKCGDETLSCCSGACNSKTLSCQGDVCKKCGDETQACCNNACNAGALSCRSNVCKTCTSPTIVKLIPGIEGNSSPAVDYAMEVARVPTGGFTGTPVLTPGATGPLLYEQEFVEFAATVACTPIRHIVWNQIADNSGTGPAELPLQLNHRYAWRARAKNTCGDQGAWTNFYWFAACPEPFCGTADFVCDAPPDP